MVTHHDHTRLFGERGEIVNQEVVSRTQLGQLEFLVAIHIACGTEMYSEVYCMI